MLSDAESKHITLPDFIVIINFTLSIFLHHGILFSTSDFKGSLVLPLLCCHGITSEDSLSFHFFQVL